MLMKSLFLFILISCSHRPTPAELNHQKLGSLFESYWDERSALFPLEATQQGDNRFNHSLPNELAPEFREKLVSFYRTYHDRVSAFDRASLSSDDQLSYDIFLYEMETQLEGMKFPWWYMPFQQFWGLPLTMGQLGSGDHFQPFKTVQDYKNWLSRLEGFTHWTNSAIDNFRQGMKAGIVLPKVLVKKMIPQMKDVVVKEPSKSLFFGPVKKFPKEFTESERVELTGLYTRAINDWVNPSYQKLTTFLEKEYLPEARNSHGIDKIPQGKDLYRYLVKYWTTTDLDPEIIYQTGLAEVARIKREMELVKNEVRFSGDLKAFFKHLRQDPDLMPYKTDEEVLQAFRNIQSRMEPQLKTMFGRVPKTPFEVKQTEEFREASASAEYSPGSPDGKRPGVFYVPIIDAAKFNITSGMESLFLHEAIPGHHYQISLQQEDTDLPKFRRFAWYGAYGEGWALYTESLGKELGLYTNPYQYMGSLGDEMHRAIRLVVDVALHTKSMSREEAIQYMMDNEPIPKEGAVSEVERYMAIPGQALSYKTGSLKIRELRTKYQTKLGEKFKLSSFHDEFLNDGCLPLAVLEKKMDRWAQAMQE